MDFDILFEILEGKRGLIIRKQSKRMYKLRYDNLPTYRNVVVKSKAYPEVIIERRYAEGKYDSDTLFIRGSVPSKNNRRLLEYGSDSEKIRVFLKGVYALISSGFNIGISIEDKEIKLGHEYLEELDNLTYYDEIYLKDLIEYINTKDCKICKI